MATLLMINVGIPLMVIDGYSIGGYWCLLMIIGGYYIGDY
jgi:hypothetical protein